MIRVSPQGGTLIFAFRQQVIKFFPFLYNATSLYKQEVLCDGKTNSNSFNKPWSVQRGCSYGRVGKTADTKGQAVRGIGPYRHQ